MSGPFHRRPGARFAMQGLSRRRFLGVGLGALLGGALPGCSSSPSGPRAPSGPGDPRLGARPGTPTRSAPLGESSLNLAGGRDGWLYVPESYDAATAVPLVLFLHGSSGSAGNWRGLQPEAERRGFCLLAVDSRSWTWDRVFGSFGPDVAFVDRALTQVFDQVRVDPNRVAVAGFSDGASYSLSLGLPNGPLFSHVVSFSPGFSLPGTPSVEKPRVWVSHGRSDGILSFSATAGTIVPSLELNGYDVTFVPYEGGHQLTAELVVSALDWFLDRASTVGSGG